MATISTTSGTISSAGIGSGLDVTSIVSSLMAIEQQPLTLLQTKEASYNTQLSALGQVKSAISDLQSAAAAVTSASAVPAYTASVGDSSVATATAGSTAAAGTHSLNVSQLAQNQVLVATGQSSLTSSIGTGSATTVTISFGTVSGGTLTNGTYTGSSFTANSAKSAVSFTIDSSNNTLSGIQDAINAANAGVTATVVNDGSGTPYRLVLTSNDTGAANSLKISVSGDSSVSSLLSEDPTGTQNLTQARAATNAQFTLDGISITKASNTVTDAINGVTLNLTGVSASSSTSTNLQIAQDSSGVTTALNSLVTAYNTLNTTISGLTGLGDTLQSDYATSSALRQLRSALSSPQAGVTQAYNLLSSIGGTFDNNGVLTLDSSKLSTALSNNYSAVNALATQIASAVSTTATGFIGTSGVLQGRIDGVNSSILSIQNQETAMQTQLDATQARYQAQFSNLDTVISSLQSTSSFLTQQLATLNPNGLVKSSSSS